MRFSTPLLAASLTASALASPLTSKRATTFQFFGVNESGAEFGQGNLPGTLERDYIWPSTSAIGTLMDKGMTTFRIPFLMERLAQNSMTSGLDATYLADLQKVVSYITGRGGYAVLDPHNYGRYKGNVITSTADFEAFWKSVGGVFKGDGKVVFDCNNEFHDMGDDTLVKRLNQACINGVRGAGANEQYIFVEGTSWTGAWSWVSSGNAVQMKDLTDPSDKIIYEMHQYLDNDASGTSSDCVSATIGVERVAAATQWLKDNKKKGILGEFAGGSNDQCKKAVVGLLDVLKKNSDVWMGALWWGGGPWWGNYIFGMEPSSGQGVYDAYIDTLVKYV
ncbi:hypothetical protein HYFRA_00007636 [Hymenoscyphus fraxineus]|uniref:cellulase n=1 Tax=Hymenoscyphus fraxineus TaxID=746836 RepID=A0A9N9KVT5_9HELO|nr:hypothetical protein HYFRA_00007636 [Hymenoscyphus fraxineus]